MLEVQQFLAPSLRHSLMKVSKVYWLCYSIFQPSICVVSDCIEPPTGYFVVTFVGRTPSRYTKNVSFRSMNQEDILATRLEEDDRRHEVSDSLIENPHFRVFAENPLHLGYYLDRISVGKIGRYMHIAVLGHLQFSRACSLGAVEVYSFIETMDTSLGEVLYKMPQEGTR